MSTEAEKLENEKAQLKQFQQSKQLKQSYQNCWSVLTALLENSPLKQTETIVVELLGRNCELKAEDLEPLNESLRNIPNKSENMPNVGSGEGIQEGQDQYTGGNENSNAMFSENKKLKSENAELFVRFEDQQKKFEATIGKERSDANAKARSDDEKIQELERQARSAVEKIKELEKHIDDNSGSDSESDSESDSDSVVCNEKKKKSIKKS